MIKLDGNSVSLDGFCIAVKKPAPLGIDQSIIKKLKTAHEAVETVAQGKDPVYGLNTGLGGNLGYRLKPEDISDFQMQIIAGRAVACGNPLPEDTGRGILLARIISAANGYSGISVELFKHLCSVYETGISPVIPEYGSIGDSDLVQNGHFGMAVLGQGDVYYEGEITPAAEAFKRLNITAPALKPKEGLAMVSHSGLTVTLSAIAINETKLALEMVKSAIVLSYEGYGANQRLLEDDLNQLRISPGQREIAQWLLENLKGSEHKPRRVQEALSFRTALSIVGAAYHALHNAISIWQDEANGTPDSPVVLDDGCLVSTANFHTPALSLAMENLSLSLAGVANGSVQRMQRIMNPDLSGLPKYLSPIGGGSAGFIPSQKTSSVLNSEIRHAAQPILFNPAPISDGVEDMAPNTPSVARKLSRQLHPFRHLIGLEALVACQAIDLRKPSSKSILTTRLHKAIRDKVPMMVEDRPMGNDINIATKVLKLVIENRLS